MNHLARRRVITISTVLPPTAKVAGVAVEPWDDVPAASVDYGASRDSLRAHVEKLLEQLTPPAHTAGGL
jgi:arsenate reductase